MIATATDVTTTIIAALALIVTGYVLGRAVATRIWPDPKDLSADSRVPPVTGTILSGAGRDAGQRVFAIGDDVVVVRPPMDDPDGGRRGD